MWGRWLIRRDSGVAKSRASTSAGTECEVEGPTGKVPEHDSKNISCSAIWCRT